MTRSKTLQILTSEQVNDYPELARDVNNALEALDIPDRLPVNIEALDEVNALTQHEQFFAVAEEFDALAEALRKLAVSYLRNADWEPVEHERELPEEEP